MNSHSNSLAIRITSIAGRRSGRLRLAIVGLLSTCLMGLAIAESPTVSWERVEGIDPHPNSLPFGGAIAGIQPVAFPWSVTRGRVRLKTETNQLAFSVTGLSMGGSLGIGTTGVVTAVKGTIVCTTTFAISDTAAVELSKDGDAHFRGVLSMPVDCNTSNLVFLLRVAEVVGGAQIQNFWLASGAVRRIE